MNEDKDSSRGFRVTDRRRFSDEGETRAGEQEAEAPSPADEVGEAPFTAQPSPEFSMPSPSAADPEPAEQPTFSAFVLGLSTQALLHLGEIEDPLSGGIQRDIGAAKQVIDIIGILKEKTRNNLEPSEEQLLDAVLYDLRMRYVELVRGQKEGA